MMTEATISGLAEAIADDYSLGELVDPFAIARECGITHGFGDYGDSFDGLLEHRSGRFHIFLNHRRCHSPEHPRARFTISHELGHFFIDEHRQALESGLAPSHPSVADYESRNMVESQADLFASNLLMPRRRFLEAAQRSPLGLQGIIEMSRRFNTSMTSTAIRYVSLDVAACAVVKWNPTRFGWKWIAPSWFKSGYRATYKDVTRVPGDSATGVAFRGSDSGPEGFVVRGSTAQTWFPYIGPGTQGNIILIEEAISLGRYGVLTLLRPDKL